MGDRKEVGTKIRNEFRKFSYSTVLPAKTKAIILLLWWHSPAKCFKAKWIPCSWKDCFSDNCAVFHGFLYQPSFNSWALRVFYRTSAEWTYYRNFPYSLNTSTHKVLGLSPGHTGWYVSCGKRFILLVHISSEVVSPKNVLSQDQ